MTTMAPWRCGGRSDYKGREIPVLRGVDSSVEDSDDIDECSVATDSSGL